MFANLALCEMIFNTEKIDSTCKNQFFALWWYAGSVMMVAVMSVVSPLTDCIIAQLYHIGVLAVKFKTGGIKKFMKLLLEWDLEY